MLTLTQIASLKRDAYRPNYGSKAYSPSVVIDLIETIEQFVGEIQIERPRPRDPFDLSYQAAVSFSLKPDQPGLFDSVGG